MGLQAFMHQMQPNHRPRTTRNGLKSSKKSTFWPVGLSLLARGLGSAMPKMPLFGDFSLILTGFAEMTRFDPGFGPENQQKVIKYLVKLACFRPLLSRPQMHTFLVPFSVGTISPYIQGIRKVGNTNGIS